MATKSLVPVEEYLRMSFDGPDREFLDGEVVERNVGEKPHSKAQLRLAVLFDELSKRHPLHVLPEIRLRVSAKRYRVADLAVFAGDEPAENVPSSPPLVTIEIVSRDDRYTDILRKLEEYRMWGVRHVWLVDPWLRKGFVYSEAGLMETGAFELPEHDERIPFSEIF